MKKTDGKNIIKILVQWQINKTVLDELMDQETDPGTKATLSQVCRYFDKANVELNKILGGMRNY